jgi:hypothetical protein
MPHSVRPRPIEIGSRRVIGTVDCAAAPGICSIAERVGEPQPVLPVAPSRTPQRPARRERVEARTRGAFEAAEVERQKRRSPRRTTPDLPWSWPGVGGGGGNRTPVQGFGGSVRPKRTMQVRVDILRRADHLRVSEAWPNGHCRTRAVADGRPSRQSERRDSQDLDHQIVNMR